MRSGVEWDVERLHGLCVRALVLAMGALVTVASVLFLLEQEKLPDLISRIQWLHIREVVVEGQWPTDSETVKTWLPRLEGKSILLVHPEKLIDQLEGRPWVKSVTIKREYPSRLRVHVVPRQAMAILTTRKAPLFIDGEGKTIEAVNARTLKRMNLPVISKEENALGWEMPSALGILARFEEKMSAKYKVSQLVLGAFPYFKIFLATPQMEIAFSAETWEDQLPHLALLLDSPPNQIGQIQRINLYYPKKAVVRSALSN